VDQRYSYLEVISEYVKLSCEGAVLVLKALFQAEFHFHLMGLNENNRGFEQVMPVAVEII